MSIQSLKSYPNILKKINSYLEPLFISNNLLLKIRNNKEYNNKLHYLTDNLIPLKYAVDYARYPDTTMQFIVDLSKLISIDDAYNILVNIPMKDYKLYNINIDSPLLEHIAISKELHKLINYNYFWCIILLKNNISVEMIKVLLNKLVDFYFFELLYINKTINNYDISFNMVIESINNTIDFKNTYYKLRTAKIPHNNAFKLSRINNIILDKIIVLANLGFYNIPNLSTAIYFDEIQMDFLKLSRLGFDTEEEFDKVKENIFNNAITENLINIDDFINKYVPCPEPLAKKQKIYNF
jgi:hypothetical protein